MNHKLNTKAFTLLEMLLVIAIIAILAGIVIVAINPGRQLAQARNAQRWSDIRSLHSAVQQFYIDNKEWPADLETVTSLTEICNTGTATSGHSIDCTIDSLIDLSELVPEYLPAIPTDPQVTASLPFVNTVYAQSATGTGYEIAIDPNTQMVMLTAPNSTEYDLPLIKIGVIDSNNTIAIDETFPAGSGFNAGVTSIAQQSDGKLIVAGSFTEYNGEAAAGIIRLNLDGTRDTSFITGTGLILHHLKRQVP